METHSRGGSYSDGTASSCAVAVSEAVYAKCPNLFYMLLVGCATATITDGKEKAGRGARAGAGVDAHPLEYTPICTAIYRYLH